MSSKRTPILSVSFFYECVCVSVSRNDLRWRGGFCVFDEIVFVAGDGTSSR